MFGECPQKLDTPPKKLLDPQSALGNLPHCSPLPQDTPRPGCPPTPDPLISCSPPPPWEPPKGFGDPPQLSCPPLGWVPSLLIFGTTPKRSPPNPPSPSMGTPMSPPGTAPGCSPPNMAQTPPHCAPGANLSLSHTVTHCHLCHPCHCHVPTATLWHTLSHTVTCCHTLSPHVPPVMPCYTLSHTVTPVTSVTHCQPVSPLH